MESGISMVHCPSGAGIGIPFLSKTALVTLKLYALSNRDYA